MPIYTNFCCIIGQIFHCKTVFIQHIEHICVTGDKPLCAFFRRAERVQEVQVDWQMWSGISSSKGAFGTTTAHLGSEVLWTFLFLPSI